ncbi:MAG: hypothetical protein R3C05_24145 [Pirellulaceae bacterium]
MWHTSTGDRTLTGAEATLIADACVQMIDALEWALHDEEGLIAVDTGVALYDEQSLCQRIGLLNEVCRGLFSSRNPMPILTAELEATVMSIFETIKTNVQLEIDAEDCYGEACCESRSLVFAAFTEANASSKPSDLEGLNEFNEIPSPWCDEMELWELGIESLADQNLVGPRF